MLENIYSLSKNYWHDPCCRDFMNKSAAQTAYEAYATFSDWKSLISGAPLPEWGDLPNEVKMAWEAAAEAVINHNQKIEEEEIEGIDSEEEEE